MYWEVFTKITELEIQIHWVTAILSFFTGLIVLLLPKGTPFHKLMGRIYVLAMVATAFAGFFIRTADEVQGWAYLSLKGMTWIHLFIPVTLIGLGMAIWNIKKGNVKEHKSWMLATFLGALVITGAFTFLPGRRMHLLFFGPEDRVEYLIDRQEAKRQH